MDRKKIFELMNLALDIQEMGTGENGFPYVLFSTSNYYQNGIRIEVMDNGFRSGAPYDGCYVFKNVGEISERVYNACLEHLKELKQRAEGFLNDSGI